MNKAVLFVFILSLSFASTLGDDYVFEKISPETGFVFDAIKTICLDSNGMVWFGTGNGLYYYNSIEVKRVEFQTADDKVLQTVNVLKVYHDDNGRIWICTNIGLFQFLPNKNRCEEVLFEDSRVKRGLNVSNILQVDTGLYVFIGSRSLYLYTRETNHIETIIANEGYQTIRANYLCQGENGKFLIGTGDGKLFEMGNDFKEIKLLYASPSYSRVKTICYKDDKYYIGFDGNGVEVIDSTGTKIDAFKRGLKGGRNLPNDRVREIIKRKNGDIWIGTYRGIHVVSESSSEHIVSSEENGLPHSSIYVLYKDNNDGIWVGTWAGGIAYYSDFNYRFKSYKRIPYGNNESNGVISSFSETEDGQLLIGCDYAGLFVSDQAGTVQRALPLKKGNLAITKVKSLEIIDKSVISIGTFDEGLWFYDFQTGKLNQLKSDVLSESLIISSQTLIQNDLWIGTRTRGLFKYDLLKKSVTKISLAELYSQDHLHDKIWKTYKDSKQNLWVCTDDGFFIKESDQENFKRFQIGLENQHNNKTMVYSVCEDHKGQFWLGTQGKGLFIYNPVTDSIHHFKQEKELSRADVYGIVKDGNNDLWFTTNGGLFRRSAEKGDVKYFTNTDGLPGNLYNPNSTFLSSSGNLFFGTPNGYNVVNPSIVKENPYAPKVFLSKILINNKSIDEEQPIKINSKHIAELRSIKVKHFQNSLTFSFVSNNFIKSVKNKFIYRLKNYQDEWAETRALKDITFTKLPPGNYTLEVLGTNNDGVQSVEPLAISIFIKPAWWQRWYAYMLYIVIAVMIYYVVVRELVFRVNTRKEIVTQRYKNEASELLHKEKLQFFTNVSHEFRTPLTLIISPLNNLLTKFQYDQATLNHLKIISRNADRLQRLTNQMLDFRMLELGKVKAKVKKTDVIEICKEVTNCFEIQIQEKQINYIFKSDFKSLFAMVDPDMIEKIIFNIVANAIKFSNEKDQLIVSAEKKSLTEEDFNQTIFTGHKFLGNALSIRIQDKGVGISSDMLPTIFNRFSRGQDQQNSGTGIGLHMCQEFARLNGANIVVNSEENGGTTFILNLPLDDNIDFVEENILYQPQYDRESVDEYFDMMPESNNRRQDVVLLAEDNDDLRLYLKGFLGGRFKVLTAKNGKQAVEIASEIIPDIIITDIMMPGKDGMEVTKEVKENEQTKHIPVIVLTALSEKDYQKQSIMKGADAFLTKPIDSTVLLAQVENMLSNREILKEKFEVSKGEVTEVGRMGEESFLIDVEVLVEKNMQNPEFDITQLTKALNISRSSLHRKIRSSTNQSITEFIRDIRLKNAIKLLKGDKYNMAEIGFYVGFNSTSYFIRSFKNKYGVTPKEFSKSLKDG